MTSLPDTTPGDAILDLIIPTPTASTSKATVYAVKLAKRKNHDRLTRERPDAAAQDGLEQP
jgi:hypothetical protein